VEELRLLVVRAQAGDLSAYGDIVKRLQDMAYGYAYSILGDFHLSEDAAQEAFIQAYRDLPALREPAAFSGWLRRIVFKCCDRMTRGKHIPTAPLSAAVSLAANNPDPVKTAEQRELRESVLAAVRTLPDREREVTTLFYIDGYSQKDIAEFLEIPATTVNNRLHTSRKRLKKGMIAMVKTTLKSSPLPNNFADVVVRRATSQEDLNQAAGLLSYTSQKRPEQFESLPNAKQAGVYVIGKEGVVYGAACFNECQFSIGSTILRAIRPNEIGAEAKGVPHPAFVRSCHGCFKLARQKGIHLSIVHGSQYDHALCGFVPCFYHPCATLPRERLKSVVTRATVRKVRDEAERRNGWVAFLQDPYATKIGGGCPGPITHVIEQGNVPVGYLGWKNSWVNDWADVTVQTREGSLAALKLMAKTTDAENISVVQSHMTMIAQVMLNLGGDYLLRRSCDLVGLDNEMVSIIDLPGLASDLAAEFHARFKSSALRGVKRSFSLEMNGATVGFVASAEGLAIVTKKQKVHRVLPRWIMTRLFMGYYSGNDVLNMGPIPCDRSDGKTPDDPNLDMKEVLMPETEAALFSAVFPKLWPCSWPDPDVWPWVIGKKHPMYQHEEKKTPEMKAEIDALRFPWIGY